MPERKVQDTRENFLMRRALVFNYLRRITNAIKWSKIKVAEMYHELERWEIPTFFFLKKTQK